MAIPIASIGSLPTTLEPSAQAATGTAPATGTQTQAGDLFGTLLAAESAPATTVPSFLDIATGLTTDLTTDQTTDGTALTGLLAFAAQILNIPANAAVAQANGESAPASAPVQLPSDPRTRADQLALGTANVPALPAAPQPAPSRPPQPPLAALEPVPLAEPDQPSAAELADRAARSPRTSTPNVVAQPPLITLGAPVPPAAPALTEVTPPVAEPVAAVPTSALPDATLGARPSTAGEQYAALASIGERLAVPVEPTAPVGEPESPRAIAPATFASAVRDANPAIVPTAVQAPQASTSLGATAAAPPARPVRDIDEGGIIELPPAIPQAPVVSNAPTARVAFPAVRNGIPVAQPAVAPPPESDVARSALVIASAAERLAPRGEFAPNDVPPGDAPSAAPAFVPAPPAPDRVSTAPAPAAPATTVAPQPLADQVADALVSRAEVVKRDGATEFQMRLDPPELGRMHVKLVASGDDLRGHVLVADDSVRRLLESQLPELRHKLEAAGVSVQSLEVATDPNGGNRGAFRDEPGEERPAFAPPVPRDPEPPRRPRAPVAARVGALDVTV